MQDKVATVENILAKATDGNNVNEPKPPGKEGQVDPKTRRAAKRRRIKVEKAVAKQERKEAETKGDAVLEDVSADEQKPGRMKKKPRLEKTAPAEGMGKDGSPAVPPSEESKPTRTASFTSATKTTGKR